MSELTLARVGMFVQQMLETHPELIQISGVDAANPESLENALRGVTGPICISTEGMMMYFTETEASPD